MTTGNAAQVGQATGAATAAVQPQQIQPTRFAKRTADEVFNTLSLSATTGAFGLWHGENRRELRCRARGREGMGQKRVG